MMAGEVEADEDAFGELVALKGVVKYPVRVKCAVLMGRAPGGPGERRRGRGLGPPLARTPRQETFGADRALIVHERTACTSNPASPISRSHVARGTAAHVLVELGVHRPSGSWNTYVRSIRTVVSSGSGSQVHSR